MATEYRLNETGPEVQERLNQVFTNRDNIAAESTRAASEEEELDTVKANRSELQAETERAQGAEAELASRIDVIVNEKAVIDAAIADRYTKEETYSKAQLDNLITTPNQQYVTVDDYDSLPATGSADTIYRVSSWDGTQFDESRYTEYAWDGTQYMLLSVKSQAGEVFDISEYNSGATYADLAAALGTDGANVPSVVRKGGMSIKFIQSSDNKYVQYRLMATTWSNVVGDWSGEDEELKEFTGIISNTKTLTDVPKYSIVEFKIYAGHTYSIVSSAGAYFVSSDGTDNIENFGISVANKPKIIKPVIDANYIKVGETVGGVNIDFTIEEVSLQDRIENIETIEIPRLDEEIGALSSNVVDLEQKVDGIVQFSISSAGAVPYEFKAGKTYIISNTGSGTNFSTRLNPSGDTIEDIGYITGNKTKEFNCTINANYLRIAASTSGEVMPKNSHEVRITEIENELDEEIKPNIALITDKKVFSDSGAASVAYTFTAGHTYIIYNSSDSAANLSTRTTSGGSTVETLPRIQPLRYVIFNCTTDASYLRHNPGLTGYIISADTVEGSSLLNKLNIDTANSEIKAIKAKIPPMVKFNVKHELPNIHTEYSLFDWAWAKDSQAVATPFVTQVYDAFDGLVSSYPNMVSKEDLAVKYNKEYPRYANGITEGDPDYLETPAYKIYLYKILSSTSANTSLNPKRKVLIIACCQGYEFSMAFDSYVFANFICKMHDANFFKLQAACDFYIVPVMDPYGVYHKRRCNANGVNLNRNFDNFGTGGFVPSGEPGGWTNYTGPYAYSEFESQLIKAIVDDIHPDMVIDHHEFFNVQGSIIFSTSNNKAIAKSGYDCLADMAYTYIKEKPVWFGNDWNMFLTYTYTLPATVTDDTGYTIEDWASYYQEGCFGILIEGFSKISMLDGEVDASTGEANKYTEDVMSCAAYSFQTQMMHFIEKMCELKENK